MSQPPVAVSTNVRFVFVVDDGNDLGLEHYASDTNKDDVLNSFVHHVSYIVQASAENSVNTSAPPRIVEIVIPSNPFLITDIQHPNNPKKRTLGLNEDAAECAFSNIPALRNMFLSSKRVPVYLRVRGKLKYPAAVRESTATGAPSGDVVAAPVDQAAAGPGEPSVTKKRPWCSLSIRVHTDDVLLQTISNISSCFPIDLFKSETKRTICGARADLQKEFIKLQLENPLSIEKDQSGEDAGFLLRADVPHNNGVMCIPVNCDDPHCVTRPMFLTQGIRPTYATSVSQGSEVDVVCVADFTPEDKYKARIRMTAIRMKVTAASHLDGIDNPFDVDPDCDFPCDPLPSKKLRMD